MNTKSKDNSTIGVMQHVGLGLGALIAAVIMFIAVNLVVGRGLETVRLDLTEDQLYTLSDGTRQTLQTLKQSVHLRFYASERLAEEVTEFQHYANRVQALLREFSSISGGRLQVEYLNPKPFSDIEDRAIAFGLQGVPVDESGERVFFGIAGTNSVDDTSVISWLRLERERFLEHDLTKLIYTLANPEKPTLGILSSLPLNGGVQMTPQGRPAQTPPWLIAQQWDELIQTKEIPTDIGFIDPQLDVLMVVHPQKLPIQTLYAIDQFVLGGGNVIVLVDPHSEAQQIAAAGNPGTQSDSTASNLTPLFKAWGVHFDSEQIAGDRRAARRVALPDQNNARAGVDYLAWLSLSGAASISTEDPVTSELEIFNLASSGFFTPIPEATSRLVPLLQTGDGTSMVIPANKIRTLPDPARLLDEFQPGGTPLILAARVTGSVKSAFPDGKPEWENQTAQTQAEEEIENSTRSHLSESSDPINLILIGDTDLLADRMWAQTQNFFGQKLTSSIADNARLLTNMVDNLAGSDALISLRSRGTAQRPFTFIEALRLEAEQKYRANERDLLAKLSEIEKKLSALRSGQTDTTDTILLSLEKRQEISNFQNYMLKIRRELRNVQQNLRNDINDLEENIRFFNIWLPPILVVLIAVLLNIARVQRRRRRIFG